MTIPIRRLVWFLLACSALPAFADEVENRKRLEAMPRERRVTLAENLDRFDKLPPAEQAEIRRLDNDLTKLEPAEAARYRQVSRRYHLWVESLSDDQKKQLREATTTEARFNLAVKFRRKDNDDPAKVLPKISGIRIGEYGMIGPYEAAHLLRVWNTLTPARQADLAKRDGPKLRDELWFLGQESGLAFASYSFAKAEEARFEARLEADAEFMKMLGPLAKSDKEKLKAEADRLKKAADLARAEADRTGKIAAERKGPLIKNRAEEAEKRSAEAQKNATIASVKAANSQRRFEHAYAEFLYFEEIRPQTVLSKNFERFVTSCPPWFLEMVEPLSPDDARDYLTIIYRLLYPRPNEVPDPALVRPKTDTSKPPQGPRPASKKQQKTEFDPF